MKKINLTIPKPCHESWDQMTPEDKGRFCGSCQKTVIDFTNMSDRELANFFKKPVASVCGRFHQDQLNREITVPKKRIPWLRYFFHIAWPAFILMLKSCGLKDRVVSKATTTLAVNSSSAKTDPYEDIIVGALKVPDSLYVETVEAFTTVEGEVGVDIIDEPDTLTGDIMVNSVGCKNNTDTVVSTSYALPEDWVGKVVATDAAVVADTSISNYDETGIDTVIAVAPINTSTEPTARLVKETTEPDLHSVIAYPNPSRAGSVLNLKFAEKESAPVSVQLLTSGGQRVVHKMLGKPDYSTAYTLQLPSNITSGMYFIQVLYANGSKNKVAVMVSQ